MEQFVFIFFMSMLIKAFDAEVNNLILCIFFFFKDCKWIVYYLDVA